MKTIPLTQGRVAIVDDADYDTLNRFKWYWINKGAHGYAVRGDYSGGGAPRRIWMHRELCQSRQIVDHISGNSLDNRRENLRGCSQRDNTRNRLKHIKKTSRFKGVHWEPRKRLWRACIRVCGKLFSLGRYKIEEHAAISYNAAASAYFGDFAKPNECLGSVS